jgi:hypothetical protein
MLIDEQTMSELLKLGSQYMLPVAALLRALYSGIRGKFPEGFLQIIVASFFSGLTAIVGNKELDILSIIRDVMGNTIFMAGLLSFIMVYLLRMKNRGFYVDGVVGTLIGLAVWVAWRYILGNDWPWYTIPLAAIAGGVGFIVLRVLLRQIFKLVRIATYFIIAGIVLVIGAGAILVLQQLLQTTPQ